MVEDERIRHLRELCRQAEELRLEAEKLCGELGVQLERSLRSNPPDTAYDMQHGERRRAAKAR